MLATTVEQAKELSQSLREIDVLVFNTKQSLEEKLNTVFSPHQKTVFVKLAKRHNLSLKVNELKTLSTIIQDTIHNMPRLGMTIAFDPTVEQVENIADWLFINCKKAFLLDITVNPHIIGGAIVGTNGKYRDYSLRKKLEILQASKFEILNSKSETNLNVQNSNV